MEYDCHIFSKYLVFQTKTPVFLRHTIIAYLVFQMENLIFQSKYRNT